MNRTVIWATDGSDCADLALREAIRLADWGGGRVLAAHCDQRLIGRAAEWPVIPNEDERLTKIRHQVADLRAAGVDIDLVVRTSHRHAADVVSEVAAEEDAMLIVCGTRGAGAFAGAFLGSFAQRLLHVAPCPVVCVRQQAAEARLAAHAPVRAEEDERVLVHEP
jgi:nucleotide-binding universal stress UspA family protein